MPGFIGSHLAAFLTALPDTYEILPFEDDYFESRVKLTDFVTEADTIIHLAGVNRHEDDNYIYSRNVELASKLIEVFKATGKAPQVIFASSTQESRDNSYGKGKREARSLLTTWAAEAGAPFVGLIIPHAVRRVSGIDHRLVLPASFCVGGSFLTLCDLFARTVVAPTEMPVGIITAIIGGPVFFRILLKRKRNM